MKPRRYLARFGLANRINAIIECICAGGGEVLWQLNHHCPGQPGHYFKGLNARVRMIECGPGVPEDAIDAFLVSPHWDAETVREAAEFMLGCFMPQCVPERHLYAVHVRHHGSPPYDPRSFAEIVACNLYPAPVFLLADSGRAELAASLQRIGMGPVTMPLSPELMGEYDRSDLDAQLKFCRDLKTLWSADVVLANSLSTIPDMRAYLGRPTLRPPLSSSAWSGKSWASLSAMESGYLMPAGVPVMAGPV